jgi:hypothetical protein
VIFADSRKTDRLKGFDNNMTVDFIRDLINRDCIYCGETKLRMTLDRIDNTKGYVVGNVNPSCIRCNYTRGSMPYAAWLHLVPGMRSAREAGVFEAWTGRAR